MTSNEQRPTSNLSLFASLPVFLAFLCMGFGDAVGPFVGLAKDSFNLTNTVAQLIPFTGFLMFGLLSVPFGILQDQKGKKFILALGLVVALVGLVIPIINFSTFAFFLVTILFLGAGAAILQVAGNPIMRDVSPEGKYARNLSLGQFVKAIGSLSGPVLPVIALKYWGMDWKILFPVYSIILAITLIILLFTRLPNTQSAGAKPANFKSCFALLRDPFVSMMVFAIFIYVGAEVCMSSGLPLYFKDSFGVDIQKIGLLSTGLFFVALMAGRFLGSVILSWISARTFFVITCIISILGILGMFTGNEVIAYISACLTGLGFANIFPLVFSITIERMPERANELSGLMVTAIVGGALVPLVMGIIADRTSTLHGFLVPLICLGYITFTAFRVMRRT